MKKFIQIALLALAATFVGSFRAPAQEVGVDVFYNELGPHGTWFESPDYGYVWQPRVAGEDRAWRPYVDGQWAFTDRGWSWVSNEPFGWAVYHYGRWTNLAEVGWVWVPGREWGPGWVSWRRGEEHVGWAPLPPRRGGADMDVDVVIGSHVDVDFDIGPGFYTFIPVTSFGAHTYRGLYLRPEENITIIEKTRNVTYVKVVNKVVYNFGPDYEEIRIRTREPVRRMRLVALDHGDRDRVIVRGDTLQYYAPRVVVKKDVRPEKVARRIEVKEERKGWEVVKDETTRKRLTQKMESEPKEKQDRRKDEEAAASVAKEKPAKEGEAGTAMSSDQPAETKEADQKAKQEREQADQKKAGEQAEKMVKEDKEKADREKARVDAEKAAAAQKQDKEKAKAADTAGTETKETRKERRARERQERQAAQGATEKVIDRPAAAPQKKEKNQAQTEKKTEGSLTPDSRPGDSDKSENNRELKKEKKELPPQASDRAEAAREQQAQQDRKAQQENLNRQREQNADRQRQQQAQENANRQEKQQQENAGRQRQEAQDNANRQREQAQPQQQQPQQQQRPQRQQESQDGGQRANRGQGQTQPQAVPSPEEGGRKKKDKEG